MMRTTTSNSISVKAFSFVLCLDKRNGRMESFRNGVMLETCCASPLLYRSFGVINYGKSRIQAKNIPPSI